MGFFSKNKTGPGTADRRHYPRRYTDQSQVYLYAHGFRLQRCRVYDISRVGMFVETGTSLPLALPVELAFTCLYTRRIVKMYRRSAYVARTSENGVAVLFFNRFPA
ncbi:MAG: hypothetical protein PVH38_08775 [Gammaproteobacteria bacterium]|jgi:hypothetical protein